MKASRKTYFLFILGFLFSLPIYFAQEVKAFAQLDTQKIRIGEPVKLNLLLSLPSNLESKITWPQFADTITKEIEVISVSQLKTSKPNKTNPNLLQQELELTLTSFDSGYWAIPPFIFLVDKDSSQKIETQALLLEVNTVPTDTAETSVKDIKPPYEEPVNWREYLPEILITLAIIAGIILLIFLLRKLIKKKPKKEEQPKVKIAAHLLALKELEAIRNKKYWQEGKLKEYYTSITDTLRTYLENRFGIHAMELTTDEIMQIMKSQVIDSQSKEKLQSVLQLADTVKFAKANPIDIENEMTLTNAISFVKGTMREEPIQESNPTKEKESHS